MPTSRALMMLVLLSLAAPVGLRVVGADEPAAPAPAAQPSDAQIASWIRDLASEDFRTREEASKRLVEAGPTARRALAEAARDAQSLEARWRAQQILRRLDGTAPTPLDRDRGARELEPSEDGAVELRRAFEEMRKRLEEQLKQGFDLPFPSDRGTRVHRRVQAGRLTAERMPDGGLRVIVQGDDGEETTYEGASWQAVMAKQPHLAEHPDVQALRALVDSDLVKTLTPTFPHIRLPFIHLPHLQGSLGGPGVRITTDGNGTRVHITERDDEGKPVTRTYEGTDLEAIKKAHPEVARRLDALGRFKIQLETAPQILRPGERTMRELLERFQRPSPARPTLPREPLFGVSFQPPSEALAHQLGLEPGHGALVLSVVPGSQAEALGLERHDIILRVDETPVAGAAALVKAFTAAAEDATAPLEVEIVRRGSRTVLTR